MPPLVTRTWGDGPPLVLLHGFTQTAAAWGPFGQLLGCHRTIVAVDLPGHGGSASIAADLEETADRVLELFDDEPFDLLGYSLGGRVALTLALTRPGRLSSLILVGRTAGKEDPVEAADRRRRDEALATLIEAEDDVPAFVERWLAQELFADLGAEAAEVDARLANTAAGLADSLRRSGAGTQMSRWDQLAGLTIPTLVIAGEDDQKYSALGRRMVDLLPDGRLVLIAGAGHACHLTRPSDTAAVVEGWLG